MANNLAIKVTADVADLQSKFAIARAEASQFSSELNKLARASINGGLDATATARLQQVSGDYAHAKAEAAAFAQQLRGMRESSAGLGSSLEGVQASISRAFQVTGIAAAAAAVMKVGEAITSLGERAIEIRTMSAVLGVTTSQFQAMQVAAEEAGVSEETFVRACEKLTVLLEEARNGSGKAVEKLHALGITTADVANKHFQLNDVLAVLKTRLTDASSAEQTRKALLQELGSRMGQVIEAFKEYDGSQAAVAAANKRVNALTTEQIEQLKKAKTGWSELGTAISNAWGKAMAAAEGFKDVYKNAVLANNPQLAPGGGGGSVRGTIDRSGAPSAEAREKEAQRNKDLQDEMAKIRESVAAFATGTAERLAMLRQYAADAKQYYGAGADETQKRNSELLAEERAYRTAQGREVVADAREQAQAVAANASLSLAQRAQAERQIWVQVLSNDRIVGAQRVEAAREFSREMTEIAKQTAAQTAAITRQDVAADISISRMKIEAAKEAINMTAAADSAAVAAKLARLRELTAQEFVLDQQALQNELATLNVESAAYNAVYNQIRQLKQKLVVDLAKLDKEAAAENKRIAQEEVTARKMATNEILSAEGTLVGDLLGRRKTLAQSLQQIGAQMVQQEITNDLKAMTMRMIIQDKGEAETKASMQGGMIYHGVVELQKMIATARSQAAQTAANAAGNTARLSSDESAAATGKAVAGEIGAKTVMQDAAKAYSGTYASVAQIPYVGPYIAPAAAATAYAAVAAFEGLASLDRGTNYVIRGGLANIHEGEAVVPKRYNPAAGGSPGVGGGGDTHLHMHLAAFDGASMQRLMQSSDFHDAMRTIATKYLGRNGHR